MPTITTVEDLAEHVQELNRSSGNLRAKLNAADSGGTDRRRDAADRRRELERLMLERVGTRVVLERRERLASLEAEAARHEATYLETEPQIAEAEELEGRARLVLLYRAAAEYLPARAAVVEAERLAAAAAARQAVPVRGSWDTASQRLVDLIERWRTTQSAAERNVSDVVQPFRDAWADLQTRGRRSREDLTYEREIEPWHDPDALRARAEQFAELADEAEGALR